MKKLFFLVPVFFLSCGEEDATSWLPPASGAHGEIVVIMDDGLWNGPIGELLVSKMSEHCRGPYLRPEPLFNYTRVRPDGLSHINQLNRLLLKLMIDKDSVYQTTQMLELENYFAKGQLFIVIKDSDIDRLYSFVLNDFQFIADAFNQFELQAFQREYRNDPNTNVDEKSKEKFGLSISLPADSKLAVEKDSFLWVKRDRSHNMMGGDPGSGSETYWITQGILFWAEPYTNASQLIMDSLLQRRDTLLKYNVPGRLAGSYMSTEYDPYYKPQGHSIQFAGYDGYEIRGLWRYAGERAAVGGGPFVQRTVLNKKRNMLITICGYIYGPKFDKREYIREVDAMLSSIELIE